MKINTISKAITLCSAIVAISTTSSCVISKGGVRHEQAASHLTIPIAKPVLDASGQPIRDLFISPYRPYNSIDTKGYKSGDVVGDPSTIQLNKKTGKPELSTVKTFRIP